MLNFKNLIILKGFESVADFHKLNTSVNLADPRKMEKYMAWKEHDRTKEGLLKVIAS